MANELINLDLDADVQDINNKTEEKTEEEQSPVVAFAKEHAERILEVGQHAFNEGENCLKYCKEYADSLIKDAIALEKYSAEILKKIQEASVSVLDSKKQYNGKGKD